LEAIAEEPASSAPSTARRVTDVLYALTESESGMSVRSIAERTENSRSSTHRILQVLSEDGYAEQRIDGGYVAGPKLVELGARVFGVVPILRYADELMRRLVQEVGETCYFATFNREEMFATFIHRVESDQPVRHVQPLGNRIPLHAGAVGKAILVAADDIDINTIELVRFTPHTITSRREFVKDIEASRARGYAVSYGERVEGIVGVASALTSGSTVVGGLAVAIPVSRVPEDGVEEIGEAVRKYAAAISATLAAMGVKRV
jgi:IclR family transcriptional regulator, acetate operon repressor